MHSLERRFWQTGSRVFKRQGKLRGGTRGVVRGVCQPFCASLHYLGREPVAEPAQTSVTKSLYELSFIMLQLSWFNIASLVTRGLCCGGLAPAAACLWGSQVVTQEGDDWS